MKRIIKEVMEDLPRWLVPPCGGVACRSLSISETLKNSSDENHEGNPYELSCRAVPAPGTNGACTNGVSATKLRADRVLSCIMIHQNCKRISRWTCLFFRVSLMSVESTSDVRATDEYCEGGSNNGTVRPSGVQQRRKPCCGGYTVLTRRMSDDHSTRGLFAEVHFQNWNFHSHYCRDVLF